ATEVVVQHADYSALSWFVYYPFHLGLFANDTQTVACVGAADLYSMWSLLLQRRPLATPRFLPPARKLRLPRAHLPRRRQGA
ncbi:hypothetical protein KJ865_02450, partial [Myxococcota bacterium]|nr:hypothetical protein [Myxococcota bacterium]